MGQGQLNLQGLSCGKGETGRLRLLVPALGVPGLLPNLFPLYRSCWEGPSSCPAPAPCAFDLLVGPYDWFLSLHRSPACEGTGWRWEGFCAVPVCAIVGRASHSRGGLCFLRGGEEMDLVRCPQLSLDCGILIPAWPRAPPTQARHRNKIRGGTGGGRVVCVSTEVTLGLYLRTA